MIQRITRDTTRGVMVEDLRVVRKVERGEGVVGCRARRWMVQRGILTRIVSRLAYSSNVRKCLELYRCA
jgi:hypothetical protein